MSFFRYKELNLKSLIHQYLAHITEDESPPNYESDFPPIRIQKTPSDDDLKPPPSTQPRQKLSKALGSSNIINNLDSAKAVNEPKNNRASALSGSSSTLKRSGASVEIDSDIEVIEHLPKRRCVGKAANKAIKGGAGLEEALAKMAREAREDREEICRILKRILEELRR
ncbi:hypothetical protein BDN70DRAFT_939463 [Pholiota conissans]|uniref:Uncharacterized protein n=1 Tax=Pholiota conissans TaxID=109636 RepID=A0A9P6CLJ8_9AGAR|nr:hypothetical protein BDN70DRAFT_939463 [Pholiota conissans]